MKTLIMCLLVLGLTGCSHSAYVKSWDGDEKTLCGDDFTYQKNFEEKAAQVCQSKKFKAVKYFQNTYVASYSKARFNKNELQTNYASEQCYVYKCE